MTKGESLPAALAAASGLGGTAILLACGLLPNELPDSPLPLPIIGFVICLTTMAGSTLVLLRRGYFRSAVTSFVSAAALLYFSSINLYGKHWTPWRAEPHRHQLWDLGHEH